MTAKEKLKEILEKGRDWERNKTTIKGMFIVKMPAGRNRPASLAIEINPANELFVPTKKRGFFIRSRRELEELKEILLNPKVDETVSLIEALNPQEATAKGEEVIEL